MADGSADKPRSDRWREAGGPAEDGPAGDDTALDSEVAGSGPDVYLDVPVLKVEEIGIEVDNLEAHVSLAAAVLDLLKLNVGADAFLGKVNLEIKGVEAQARLEVRLDKVALIVDRVLTTLDRNPEILQHIGRGVESAARGIGSGAGQAVGELGKGAGGAVQDVGQGAGQAVGELGKGAGGAVQDVGQGAGQAVGEVGKGAGGAVKGVGEGAGQAAGELGKDVGGAVEDVGKGAGQGVGEATGGVGKTVGDTVGNVGQGVTGGEGGQESNGREGDADPGGDADRKGDAGREGNGGRRPGRTGSRGDGRATAPRGAESEPPGDDSPTGPDHVGDTGTLLQDAIRDAQRSVAGLNDALQRMAEQAAPRRGER